MWRRLFVGCSLACVTSGLVFAAPPIEQTAKAIREEALKQVQGEVSRPLPLAASWNTGWTTKKGFTPDWQIKMIEQGRHLLPWFPTPEPTNPKPDFAFYEAPAKRLAQLKLPISFSGTQWESLLTTDTAYFNLPADKNPNVIGLDGKPQQAVCPFGPLDPWKSVGAKWGSTSILAKMQQWYPDPPLVLFVSNNEHAKLRWKDVEQTRRYMQLYGAGHADDFKRKVVGDGWVERYKTLHRGFRDAFTSPQWQANARFVGYNAFGPWVYGRFGGWPLYSLHVYQRTSPWPIAWDGGSPPYYLHHWEPSTDYTVFSPQVHALNWVFMNNEAYSQNQKFWFELSVWDGHQPGRTDDKRLTFTNKGQTYTPQRYAGMVQFGMWLLRPRVVREFRGHVETRDTTEPYMIAVMDAVDRVWADETLARFWRTGKLVANTKYQHPFQAEIPTEAKTINRWYMLDTNLDPPRPWKLETELKVFALALVAREAPNREWLVYAHAPRGEEKKVKITLPGYGVVTMDVSVQGSFTLVKEVTQMATQVNGGTTVR